MADYRERIVALDAPALLHSLSHLHEIDFFQPFTQDLGTYPRSFFRPNLGRSKYMEQRRLRLGDILDDYCPRERRVTNHAVVAMIEEKVQQTRCTTCDAEHVYKGGKEPRRRSRKDSPEGLYQEVLAGMPDGENSPAPIPVVAAAAAAVRDDERSVDEMLAAGEAPIQAKIESPALIIAPDPTPEPILEARTDEGATADDGPFHRRLIRAQLPRIEGHKEVRQDPDFSFRTKSDGTRTAAPVRGMRGPGGPSSSGRGGQQNNAGNRPNGRRFAGGGNPGMPGSRGPGGPGRGPSGPGRGPAGRGGGRPGFGGPSSGSGRGPSNGPPRGGPRKRSR